MFGMNSGIAGQVLVRFGTEVQKAAWLPGLASGEIVASFALTEVGAGSTPPVCRVLNAGETCLGLLSEVSAALQLRAGERAPPALRGT
jgi:hypothetical protein